MTVLEPSPDLHDEVAKRVSAYRNAGVSVLDDESPNPRSPSRTAAASNIRWWCWSLPSRSQACGFHPGRPFVALAHRWAGVACRQWLGVATTLTPPPNCRVWWAG